MARRYRARPARFAPLAKAQARWGLIPHSCLGVLQSFDSWGDFAQQFIANGAALAGDGIDADVFTPEFNLAADLCVGWSVKSTVIMSIDTRPMSGQILPATHRASRAVRGAGSRHRSRWPPRRCASLWPRASRRRSPPLRLLALGAC